MSMVDLRRRNRRVGAVRPPEPVGAFPLVVLVASAGVPAALALMAIAFDRQTSPLTWYLSRASGMTLYLLLWASAMLGLGLTTAAFDRFGSRGNVYSLHRFLTGLAYGFLSVHLLTLLIDAAVPFDALDLIVSFRATWGQPWTGLGVIAAYLLGIVGLSSASLRRVQYRLWRAAHWLTFPLFATALAHGIGSGTDTAEGWARAMYAATAASLLCLIFYRVLLGGRRSVVAPEAPGRPYDRMTLHSAR